MSAHFGKDDLAPLGPQAAGPLDVHRLAESAQQVGDQLHVHRRIDPGSKQRAHSRNDGGINQQFSKAEQAAVARNRDGQNRYKAMFSPRMVGRIDGILNRTNTGAGRRNLATQASRTSLKGWGADAPRASYERRKKELDAIPDSDTQVIKTDQLAPAQQERIVEASLERAEKPPEDLKHAALDVLKKAPSLISTIEKWGDALFPGSVPPLLKLTRK